jgi:hypothetical protein
LSSLQYPRYVHNIQSHFAQAQPSTTLPSASSLLLLSLKVGTCPSGRRRRRNTSRSLSLVSTEDIRRLHAQLRKAMDEFRDETARLKADIARLQACNARLEAAQSALCTSHIKLETSVGTYLLQRITQCVRAPSASPKKTLNISLRWRLKCKWHNRLL